MKVKKMVQAIKNATANLIAIGSKGCAYLRGEFPAEQADGRKLRVAWPELRELKVSAKQIRERLAAGKSLAALHPAVAVFGSRMNVSERGEEFIVLPETVALKRGLVRKTRLQATSRDGKRSQEFNALVCDTWKPGQAFGTATRTQFIATNDVVLGNASGAVETRWVRDGRVEPTFAVVRELKKAASKK